MFDTVATFATGTFFGAAAFISIVQHPAAVETDPAFAVRFFAPMYRRAAPMQAGLAMTGTFAGAGAWLSGSGTGFGVAAALLFAVVPFTLVVMKPINDRLIASGQGADVPGTAELLRRWAALHAVRSLLSGLAFLVLLGA